MALEILHSFVNIFAGGRSEIKAIFFVLYFVLLCTLFIFFRKYSFKSFKWIWFGITLFTMYVYGLLLHFFYIFSKNFSITDFLITGGNGEISSSVIYHTHIAKGVIGEVFYLFGKTKLETMDAGGAYVGSIPAPVFLFGSLLLLLIIFQALFYFISSFKKFLENKNKRQKIFLIFGYAILSFSLIKTSIDGGIVNPSFFIGVAFIAFFVLRTKNKLTINHYYFATFFSALILFVSLCFYYFGYNNPITVAYIATLSFLYIFILYGSEEKIRLQFLISILILLLSGWFVASARDREILGYSKIIIEKGQSVYTYDATNNIVQMSKVENTETIADISRSLNKNVTYMPVTVPSITCMDRAEAKGFFVTLISPNPVSKNISTDKEYILIRNEESIPFGEYWKTKLGIFISGCLPEPLSVIDGELKKNNINNYILLNPSFYD